MSIHADVKVRYGLLTLPVRAICSVHLLELPTTVRRPLQSQSADPQMAESQEYLQESQTLSLMIKLSPR